MFILSTAVVLIWTLLKRVNLFQVAVILDKGSFSNFLTSYFANKLRLKKEKVYIPISEFGRKGKNLKFKVSNTILNKISSFLSHIDFLVVSKIADFVSAT